MGLEEFNEARVLEELIDMVRNKDSPLKACFICRYWQEQRDDPRQPRWGSCVRMSTQPAPGMMAMSEDPEMGAMLVTHPQHYCSEFEG